FRSGTGETRVNYNARGSKIGWVVGDELYLDQDATYAELSELARDQGLTYPVTQQTLYRRVKEAGLLLRTEEGRTTYPVAVEGGRRRVLVLGTSLLCGKPGQPGQPGHTSANAGDTVPVSCAAFTPEGTKPGHQTGTKAPENLASVPVVPVVP